ncbi:unnamed protein product [Caenorhabditis angaria]|uniref:Uncharacterized protein n=1 Tax=Caenorhabditis angaria TaxID=860376 RepID=A0A9P1IWV6_9PELO|nr:unnamed protein product [Caenorhabditis angaria]
MKETENLIYFLFGAAFMGFAYIGLTVLGCCYNKLRRRRNAARPRGQIPLTIRNPTFNRAHLGNPEYPKNFSKF